MTTRSRVGIFKPKHPISLLTAAVPFEPRNFHEAVKFDVWKQAMSEEYKALVQQGTWQLVPPPYMVTSLDVSGLQSQKTF